MDSNSKTPGTVETKRNDSSEHIRRFKEFIESHYYGLLLETVRKGKKAISIDFGDLIKHDPEFAEEILEDPEDLIKACELAIRDFDFTSDKEQKKINVRFFNLPSTQNMLIRDIRSEHIGRFIHVEGVVRQKSDVRPQVTTARFECPACGNVISVIQLDTKFKEPSRCGCGRKGKFFLLNKELVDAQGIVLEEASENLEGGEQPKRMNIFLKEDLVSPLTDKKTNPGTKIHINGYVKEVPISLNTGGTSTRYDLLIEANFVDSSSEEFSDIEITKEEEEEILELASNANIKDILVKSVAPSIYGHDRIKEALLYQMVSGVRKERSDGVTTRGDMHILLIGDPGSGKCLHGSTKIILSDGSIKPIKEIVKDRNEEKIKLQLPALNLNGKINSQNAVRVWSRNEKKLLKLKTRTGKEIKVTKNHPLFTIDNGFIISKEANDFKTGERIIIPRKIDIKGSIQTIPSFTATRKSNNTKSKLFPNIVTKELSRLSGYLCGDGYLSYSKTSGWVSLTNNDKESLEDFSSLIYKLFKVKTSIRNPRKYKTTEEAYILSRSIAEFFDVNFNEIFCRSKNKKIPELILKSDNEVLKEFIKSLFECDCHVNVKKKQIEFCSISKELIEQLQLVLLRYGIVSLIKKKKKFATNSLLKNKIDSYELIISGNFLKIFKEEIGLISERKNKALENSLTKKFNTNIDLVPNVNALLKQKRIEYNLNQSQMGLKRSTYCHYEQNNRTPSFESFSKIAKHLNDPHLLTIANSNIFFDEILEINEIINDEDLVYDLEVSNVHNYIANAIVVHNSQLLKRMSKIAPKARFVSGKGASGAGLTAAVVRDEFLKGWSLEAGALVLANKGICVTGDTDILLNDNKIKKIKDIYKEFNQGKKFQVLSINDKNHNIEKANIKEVSKRTPEKLLQVKFNTGQTLKITPEHHVPYWDNGIIWKRIGQLSKGDYIFNTNDYIKFDNKKEIYSNHMMEFAGMIATDGHISKTKNTIRYYTKDYELYSRFINIVSEEFGIIPNTYNDKRSNVLQIYFSSKEVINFLNKLGIPRGNKSKEGFILDYIYNLNKNQVKSFLIGVINGDGCISNRISGGILNITCDNKIIAESYQKLFYKLGIISKVEKYKAKGGGIVKKRESILFRVVITNKENLIKIKDKRLVQEKMINLYLISKRKNLSSPFIKFDKLLEEISISLPKGKKAVLYNNSIRKHKNMKNISIRKFTLKNALNKIKGNFSLKRIVNSGVYFSKIEEIKYIQPEEVYNIQTDSEFEPNYFANFIPVHNCMIDELDKMSEDDRSAMHEALEGQTITISKANIQATLRSETTVLAAANPKFGRFDPYDSISKQIDLPPALINRFDLIFAIKDLPDRDKDEKMASFILGLHMNPTGNEGELSTDLIRKYIAYAKQNMNPVLTEGAIEEIKNYYIKMRHKGGSEGEVKSIPISARQLEGLVRIAESCAKIRLSKKVSRKDAKYAVDLLHYSLSQIGVDPETGEIDIDRIATGISSSERNKIVNVREIINKLEENLGRTIPVEEIIKAASEKGMSEDKVEEAIEKLKKSGDLFEPRRGFISRI